MTLGINDPKIRWAQHIADKSQQAQVLISNMIGGIDIKPESSVSQIYNSLIMARIEPKSTRSQNATAQLS